MQRVRALEILSQVSNVGFDQVKRFRLKDGTAALKARLSLNFLPQDEFVVRRAGTRIRRECPEVEVLYGVKLPKLLQAVSKLFGNAPEKSLKMFGKALGRQRHFVYVFDKNGSVVSDEVLTAARKLTRS